MVKVEIKFYDKTISGYQKYGRRGNFITMGYAENYAKSVVEQIPRYSNYKIREITNE